MATPPVEKRFWTVKEAAAYISVSPTALYDWIRKARGLELRAGQGPAKLLGVPPPYRAFGRNKILVPVQAFKAWAEDPSNNQDNRCSA